MGRGTIVGIYLPILRSERIDLRERVRTDKVVNIVVPLK